MAQLDFFSGSHAVLCAGAVQSYGGGSNKFAGDIARGAYSLNQIQSAVRAYLTRLMQDTIRSRAAVDWVAKE